MLNKALLLGALVMALPLLVDVIFGDLDDYAWGPMVGFGVLAAVVYVLGRVLVRRD